jgi:signal transduction histidine kinase
VTQEIEELKSEKTGHIQKMVLLEVHDTGSGISQQYKDQVFDPGYTNKETGIGMGLAVCRRVVALHHGSISFDSVAGKGTVVTIRLPYL